MTIPEAIDRAGEHLQKLNGDRPIARKEIIQETLKYGRGRWSPMSIIPSDFCYNRTNVDARPAKYAVFLMADPNRGDGLYLHVGRNYAYHGEVVARPTTPKVVVGKRHWWTGNPAESFWCEITDRVDLGTDLHCPQADERGASQWSYALIREIWSGDIVFHYSTVSKAVVGASVAGAPLEERPIIWVPHGTVGRAKADVRHPRPGWRLPLCHYLVAKSPLTLRSLQSPTEQSWIQQWSKEHRTNGGLALPFQMYPGKLRAAQSYLTKIPPQGLHRILILRGHGVASHRQ